MQNKPKDQEFRDRIGNDLGSTLFVEAGAGTGKTTALVSRLINLLTTEDTAQRTPISEIAAITFTEKAAAELRARLRRELDTVAREGGARSAAAQTALKGLDLAAIETIHAFAARILRVCALDIGLPPAFEIRDDISGGVAFDDWWEGALESLLMDSQLEGAWERYFQAGLELKHLRQFALKLHENCDRAGVPIECCVTTPDALLSLLDEFESFECSDDADRLEEYRRKVLTEAKPLRDSFAPGQARPSSETLINLVMPLSSRNGCNNGRGGNWDDVFTVRSCSKRVSELARAFEGGLRGQLARDLLERVRLAVVEYAGERKRTGVLEFQDLLILAVEASKIPAARDRIRGTFRRILVDEFQDTDPLQLELIDNLAGDEPGRSFFVGDPRQSIYRFRRADVSLYVRKRDAIPPRDRVPLSVNFRSQEKILDWCNIVFSNILKTREQGLADLDASHAPTEAVRLFGEPLIEKAEMVRILEAQAIARAIGQLREQGRSLREVTILFPTRAILFFLEREFHAQGIPYRIESRSMLFETQEARDLFSVLRAIEDPNDAIAIVAALRTPGFGCSDQDLHDHVAAGRRFRLPFGDDQAVPDTPVTRGLRDLAAYSAARQNMPVAKLAGRIVRERLLFEIGLANSRPRDVWQRYAMLLDRIRAFDESTHGTLRQFLRWVDLQIERQASVNERIVTESDDDSVRLMTVHAAKGLEFPIVFVAGLSSGEAREGGMRVTWDQDGRLHYRCKIGSVHVNNTGTSEAFEQDRAFEQIERGRVLYVACTRAKELLFVSQFQRLNQNRHSSIESVYDIEFANLAEVVRSGLRGAEDFFEAYEPPEEIAPIPIDTWPEASGETREAWEARRRAAFQSGRQPAVAATTLARGSKAEEGEVDLEDPEPRPRGRGTDFGLAVHGAMEQLPLDRTGDIPNIARAHARSELVSAEAVEAAVHAALGSAPVKAAARHRHLKEVFASAVVEGVLLEGILDLLYEGDEGLHVVDYKTNADVSTSAIERAMESYRYQAGSYALILEATARKPVREVAFVFLKGAEAVVRSLEGTELEQAKQDVRQQLRDSWRSEEFAGQNPP